MTMHEGVDFLDSRSELDLPARPGLTLARTPGDEGGPVELRVQIPAGPVAPTRYRLRRAGEGPGAAEPLRVVAEGELPQGAAGAEILVRDRGPLAPWRVFRWAVEVQGAGLWSLLSPVVSWSFVPPHGPAAPTQVAGVRQGRAVALSITVADSAVLDDTPMGPHRVEVYRAVEGRPELLSAPILPISEHVVALLDLPPSRSAVVYAARVIDPLGRPSPFALSATL